MGTLPKQLDDGLVLRVARPRDADELAALNGVQHAEPGADGPDVGIIEWTRDLFDLPHPTFRVEDTTVVEDTTTGKIVSTVFSIPQHWSYAGADVLVSRPELVATDAAYRRRGLIREQFDLIHRRGDTAGEMLQFITGIPWYYRQFGYDYALDLVPHPTLRVSEKPAPTDARWSVRPATKQDVDFLASVDAATTAQKTYLRCTRDAATWELELARRPEALLACGIFVVDDTGEPIGYVVHQKRAWGPQLPLRAFELRPGLSWLGPTAAVVAHARQMARERGLTGITLALPAGHPARRCAHTQLAVPPAGSYGIYVRIADSTAFIRTIASVLQDRLASSPASNYSGALRLDFYAAGLEIVFAEGRLVSAVPWRPDNDDDHGDAGMPREAFLHLLLGNRSIADVEPLFADCSVNTDVGGLLLDVLFPRMPLDRWWLG